MSFPSNTGTKQDDLAGAWAIARGIAAEVKTRSVLLRSTSLAGPISAWSIIDYATFLADAKVAFARCSSLSGINAYAQAQIGDATINVATEFSNMVSQLNATVAWIIANFPKDGGGFLLAATWLADGRITYRTLTTAQTAGLRTALDALIATID